MAREIGKLRNIGIIAHIDAGKTTLTERMLYYSGAKHRVGEVDKGTAETDCDVEEQERGITIYSACVTFDWAGVHVNLLDTPGHVDFTAEVERCLRVLDGAVVVFSAREGVEAQSETVWRQADRYHVPRVAFINKMDREGADFQVVLDEISSRLSAEPVAVQIPVGQGPAHFDDPFRGVIDLVAMKMLTFSADSEGAEVTVADIPESHRVDAAVWRDVLLEKLYAYSDQLMELALQEEAIPEDLIRHVLRAATLHQEIQPILCGSALRGMGVQPVLDAVAQYLPSPADVPPVKGIGKDKKGNEVEVKRAPSPDEPFSALVFKVLPAKTGDLSWARVYSGRLKANSRALNPAKNKKENVSQLWHIHATKREEQVPTVDTGDIVAMIGLRHTITGDTLCDAKAPILLEAIRFPDTVISMAIEPETTVERKKLEDTLDLLKRQDPTLVVRHEDTGQTLISGMGELHLEIIKNRLLREFNLNVKFHKPQVSYRETIASAVEVIGECQRHFGGHSLFARVTLRMEPFETGDTGVIVTLASPPDAIPESLLPVVLAELKARGEGGGLIAGFPLSRLKVTVIDAETREGETDEQAFRIALNEGFDEGLEKGGRVLLEPIMKLDIVTPGEYLGDFVGDLQKRRAVIAKTDSRGMMTAIEAHAPLKELFGYASAMRSISQGRAGCSIEPLEYAPAPPEVRKGYEI
ncbi:MAG: elongation factor G [Pirellulaceae bacterium]